MLKLIHPAKKILFIIFSCIVLTQNVYAQKLTFSDSLSKVVIGKEKEIFDAISNGDKSKAEKLYGQDYITINADGTIQNKEEAMQTFEKFKGSKATLFDRRIRVYDNIVLLTAKQNFM